MSPLGQQVLRFVHDRTEFGGHSRALYVLLTMLEALTAGRVDVVTLFLQPAEVFTLIIRNHSAQQMAD